jgi:hypothetical protein
MSPTLVAIIQKSEVRSQKPEVRQKFADNKKPAVQVASAGSGGHERA